MPTTALTRGSVFMEIAINDVSGGLNVRDALTELAQNETPDCMNVTLDERGGIRKRLGRSGWNPTPVASPLTYGYESHVAGAMLWYSEADGKLYQDSGGVLTLAHTFASGHSVQAADFADKVYVAHPTDGLYESTDGAFWRLVTKQSGQLPYGDLITVWQNKLWVARSNGTRLFFSAPGDATKWDSADDAGSNYIREGNDYPIVALHGLSGTDIQAQPALLVGKRSGARGSLHRVTDAATGDYVTLDQSVGPAGPHAITNLYGAVYLVSTDGIFTTDGQSALQPVGQKLEPLFRSDALEYTNAARFCAYHQGNKLGFAVTRKGSTVNDLCLEYNPLFQAFTARDDAMGFYLTYGATGDDLIGCDQTTGQLFLMNSTGADDGSDIDSWWASKVFEPMRGYDIRLQHVRAQMRGTLTMKVLPNFQTEGKEKTLSVASTGGQWDVDFAWDDPAVGWGEEIAEGYATFSPRQVGRAFQLRFEETSSLSHVGLPLLETGAEQERGAWALYGCNLSLTPLGVS